MKKILIIPFLLLFITSFSQQGRKWGRKNLYGTYQFFDTVYIQKVLRASDGIGFLIYDTLTTSPTFGQPMWVRPRVIQDLARVAVALTTTGKTGVATYSNTTGIFNVPNYSVSLNKSAYVASPTSADTIDVWQTPVAITITSLKAILRGTSPSVTYNIAFGTNITCTSVTTGCSNSSGFNDATIPAGSFIWIYTTAASGTIRSIAFTINYTED
jgi:hypothetical protein